MSSRNVSKSNRPDFMCHLPDLDDHLWNCHYEFFELHPYLRKSLYLSLILQYRVRLGLSLPLGCRLAVSVRLVPFNRIIIPLRVFPAQLETRRLRLALIHQLSVLVCLNIFLADDAAPCPAGTFSTTGLAPCTSCAIGSYQISLQSQSCSSCPAGQSTVSTGATSSASCLSEFFLLAGVLTL